MSFTRWMIYGVPLALAMLPLGWLLTTKLIFPTRMGEIPGGRKYVADEFARLGPLTKGERVTLYVFAATVSL